MKNSITFITLLLYSIVVFSQEEQNLEVFSTDSTWLKEIIKFPLGFAPDINYEGYEDLRFAKDWSKKDSPEFWSYTFAWRIKGDKEQTAQDLETNLKLYFDGLMKAVNKDKELQVPDTNVLFIKNECPSENSDYIGKVNVYDSFHTKTVITLNILVKSHYCEQKKTSIIVFRISPKAFDHSMWNKFDDVKFRNDDVCEN